MPLPRLGVGAGLPGSSNSLAARESDRKEPITQVLVVVSRLAHKGSGRFHSCAGGLQVSVRQVAIDLFKR